MNAQCLSALVRSALKQRKDLSAYTKGVMLVLAAHADSDGWCWPSVSTICAIAGCSAPTVYKAIRELTAIGWIVQMDVMDAPARCQKRQGNVYQIQLLNLADPCGRPLTEFRGTRKRGLHEETLELPIEQRERESAFDHTPSQAPDTEVLQGTNVARACEREGACEREDTSAEASDGRTHTLSGQDQEVITSAPATYEVPEPFVAPERLGGTALQEGGQGAGGAGDVTLPLSGAEPQLRKLWVDMTPEEREAERLRREEEQRRIKALQAERVAKYLEYIKSPFTEAEERAHQEAMERKAAREEEERKARAAADAARPVSEVDGPMTQADLDRLKARVMQDFARLSVELSCDAPQESGIAKLLSAARSNGLSTRADWRDWYSWLATQLDRHQVTCAAGTTTRTILGFVLTDQRAYLTPARERLIARDLAAKQREEQGEVRS